MILGLPLQVLSALGSFFVSFLAARAKSKAEIEAANHRMTMELLAANNESAVNFMKAQAELVKSDPYFSFTRRIIALGITFGTMTAVFLIPALFPHVPWIIEVQTIKSTFLGLFGTSTVNEFIQLNGIPLVLGEAFTHIVAVIASFYFGNRAGSIRNPYQ